MGQLGAAVEADVYLRPKSLLGVAPKLRILVHRQTQLHQVAPDSHRGRRRRGWRTQRVGNVRHHRRTCRLGSPKAYPHVARGTSVHRPREQRRQLPMLGEGLPEIWGGPATLRWLLVPQHIHRCWQAEPMTIHGQKWTPRALPLVRKTCSASSVRRSAQSSTFDPLTAACIGRGCGKAAHRSGLRCWSRRTSASAKIAWSKTQMTRTVDGRGSSGAGSTSGSSVASRSSSSGRRSQTSCSTCPGGQGPPRLGLPSPRAGTWFKPHRGETCPAPRGRSMSGGGLAVGSPPWGAALQPTWTRTSAVTCWTPSCAAMVAAAKLDLVDRQPTRATHRRAPSNPPGGAPVCTG